MNNGIKRELEKIEIYFPKEGDPTVGIAEREFVEANGERIYINVKRVLLDKDYLKKNKIPDYKEVKEVVKLLSKGK